MLELLILKTLHGGMTKVDAELEARKLLPYIQSCDVFSREEALMTLDWAKKEEKDWDHLISLGFSNAKIKQVLDLVFEEKIRRAGPNRTIIHYIRKVQEYLARQKKPLYHMERWEDLKERDRLSKLFDNSDRNFCDGLALIAQGKIEEGLLSLYNGIKAEIEASRSRDRHIASNLNAAEETIRAAYPQIRGKPRIVLGVQLGEVHQPEIYVNIPFQVPPPLIDKSSPLPRALEISYRLVGEGASVETVSPFLLEVAHASIPKSAFIKY